MADPTLKPGTPPPDTPIPDTVAKLLNIVAAYIQIDGLSGLQGIVIGDAEPGASDRDKAWLKLDAGSGRAIGIFYYSGGWKKVPVIVDSGDAPPANPKDGEIFYNTKLKGLSVYSDGAWTTRLWAYGATADRPDSPALNAIFFDTTINRLLRFTSQGWTTVDGAVGELRMMADVTVTEATERNPGWVVYTDMGGRFPRGYQDGEVSVGETGGRESFKVTANTGKNNSLGGEGTLINLTVDGSKIGGEDVRDSYGSYTKTLDKDVEILPPFKAVIFLRKQF